MVAMKMLDFISSLSPFLWLRVGFLVLIQTFQFVVLISYFLSFFPTVSQIAFIPDLWNVPDWHPLRTSQIYWLGILFFNAMVLLIALMAFKNTPKDKVQKPEKVGYTPIYGAILVEILVLTVLFAGLHLKHIGDQVIASPHRLFMIGMFLTLMSKIFLKGVVSCISRAYGHDHSNQWIGPPVNDQSAPYHRRWFYLFILISLFCILELFIPDMHALFDAVYFWERQRFNQEFAIAGAYANFYGGLPGVDVEVFYGVGWPIIFGQICKLAGTFDWLMIFQVVLWLIIAYALAWFVLYTRVFRSPLLALAVWFLFLKFRLFSFEGGAMYTFISWNASPLRFYGDVFFLAALCAHWSSRKRTWFLLAGFFCAFQLFLITNTGGILCLLFGLYLFLYVVTSLKSGPLASNQAIRDALLAGTSSVAFYGSIMLFFYGGHLLHASFWREYLMLLDVLKNGWSNCPYLINLFTAPGTFFLSISFITLYLLSIGPAVCLVLQRRFGDVRPMLIVLLSFYGLLFHQHFIFVSDPGVIDRNESVQLFLVFIWYDILIERCPRFLKQRLSIVTLIGAVLLLFNDPKWKSYPNIFHPNVWLLPTVDNSYLKEYFDKTYAFGEDVNLIQQLTAPMDRVPIVSEHEVMLLIKSRRKPFFYVFPLICSDQIGRMWWPTDQLWTIDQLQRTLGQIKNQKPPVIFVERKLFQIPTPASYHGIPAPMVQVLLEIEKDYAPIGSSPYLIAFKRKVATAVP